MGRETVDVSSRKNNRRSRSYLSQRDAEGKPTAESLVEDLKATVGEKKRVVVLMHDAGTKQLTADTLPEVIEYLRDEGFVFKNFYDIMK